jgi:D-amino-acid dehydrogenase
MLARRGFVPSLANDLGIRFADGFRPATPDKLPLTARGSNPGLWIAAGPGLGITTSLATAGILADLVAGRAPAIDAAPFAPARASRAGY